MRKAGKILLIISGLILAVLGLLFSLVEIRFLFSGEASVFTYPASKATKSVFRLFLSLFTLAAGLLPFFILSRKEEHHLLEIFIWFFSIGILVSGLILAINLKASSGATPLYLSLPILLSSIVYFAGSLLLFLSQLSMKETKDN